MVTPAPAILFSFIFWPVQIMNTVKKISKKVIDAYFSSFTEAVPKIIDTARSGEATVKHLFEYKDGTRVESVIMPFHKRHTVCLSTQSGCAMGCTFCETGKQGLVRSLTAAETVGQYLACYQWIIDDLKRRHVPKPNIVFMGEGEPLHNFDNLKLACEVLLSEKGVCLGPGQITVSTAGYLPGIKRFAELGGVNFALSLHSAVHEKRLRIIPLEKKYGLGVILPAIKNIPLKKHQYVNVEYLLIPGFNNAEDDALALCSLVKDFKAIVNIIPYNEIDGFQWQAPSEEDVAAFKACLVENDVRTMVRVSRGQDIGAACGMLKGALR